MTRAWPLWLLTACVTDVPEVPPGPNRPSGSAGTTPDPAREPLRFERSPLRRLSRPELVATVGDLLGVDISELSLPADDRVEAFTANVVTPLSPLGVDQLAAAAQSVGAWVERDAAAVLRCDPADPSCVESWVRAFGARAWRRPLSEQEVEALLTVHAAGADPARGAGLVVEALLQSPDFLYLVEGGVPEGGNLRLDGYSVAARLSYFLHGTTPDAALTEAAAAGHLDTAEGVEVQARRLLASTRAIEQIQRFHLQWLDLERLDRVSKDSAHYPIWDETLRQAMIDDVEDFVAFVYTEGAGTLDALLTAPYAFPTGPLWEVYGLLPSEGSGPVGLPPEQRAGILTLPAIQATQAHQASTSPVHRGLLVYRRLLCWQLGPPPDGVDLSPIVVEPGSELTKRELFALHQSDPACAGCHTLIDPIGFAYEHYGALGEYRTFAPEEGQAVDARSELTTGSDLDGPVNGAVELAARLAASEDVRHCVTRQWYRFALGRGDGPADLSSIDAIDQQFAASGDDLRVLLLAMVKSDAFRMRVQEETE